MNDIESAIRNLEREKNERDATIAALRARLAEVECERDAAVEGKAEVFFAVEDRERLEATIARLTRALTAGVDALRVDPRDGEPWGPYKEMLVTHAIKVVEAAQREAMEEE